MKLRWLNCSRQSTVFFDCFGAGIAILILVVGFTGAFKLHALAQAIEETNRSGIELFQRADELKNARDDLHKKALALKSDVETIREKIPDSPDETLFLRQISELAAVSGVMINDYRPGAEMKLEKHSEKEVTISCLGTYRGICQMLANLEHLPRVAKVYNLSITASNEANDLRSVEIRIRLLYGSSIQKTAKDNPLLKSVSLTEPQ
jgi:Tfp pilus assembly protein PilO